MSAFVPGLRSVGEVVEAMYEAQQYGAYNSRWHLGKVVVAHIDGSCDIQYVDDDLLEPRVPRRYIRVPLKRGRSAGAADGRERRAQAQSRRHGTADGGSTR